ncbi:MAG: FHA domain-containing protein [Deltaproteobacteria bacterium]|nr:FHA domain-containing protein [Deltaproteobacteria bacterium]
MIVCPQCSKENQDHYKFCLGCGADLPRPSENEKPLSTATPPAGVAAAVEHAPSAADTVPPEPVTPDVAVASQPAPEPQSAPEPAAQPGPSGAVCSNCGAAIPPGFAFCGSCGTPIGGAAAPAPANNPITVQESGASLVLIQPDGSEGGTVDIPDQEVAVGRDAGGFFESDAYLSPRHAIFKFANNQIIVRDENSLNGVFKKIMPNDPIEIKSGAVFRMGQELILFESIDKGADGPDNTKRIGSPIDGLWGRISLIVGKGRLGNAFPIGGDGVICGRERGNILFPDDGYISGVHLRIHQENGKTYITDLGSSNGSYIKITEQSALNNGDFILMGAQLFRIQIS